MVEENPCNLGADNPFGEQCCCICKHQRPDYGHPHTNGESILTQRGWVCDFPEGEGVHSGWPDHSVGCEVFEKDEVKYGRSTYRLMRMQRT